MNKKIVAVVIIALAVFSLETAGFSGDVLSATVAHAQAAAPEAPQAAPSPGQQLQRMLPMFLMVFLIFYFLVISPQRKQQQAHQDLVSSLKNGETVTTSGGIIGRVAGIEKDYILLEVSNGVRIKVEPASITRRFEMSGKSGSTEKPKKAASS